MKRILLCLSIIFLLTGCGKEDVQSVQFEAQINSFCDKIVEIDASINEITNESGDEAGLAEAKKELLSCLDSLNIAFQEFAALDFPEEFDYLEEISKEAGEYMTEAVNTYHILYEEPEGYSVTMEEYADENYARAYKRVKIIVSLLRGETPTQEGLTLQ